MRILVNASTLWKGGVVQVTSAFIREALLDERTRDWQFAVSSVVYDNLRRLVDLRIRRFHVFDHSPARSHRERLRVRQLAETTHPDAVFTVFGPAYVQFPARHLMGYANGWVTHPSRLAYKTLPSVGAALKSRLSALYARHWVRRADAWVTECDASRQGLHRRLGLPLNRIAVVSNTCAQHYFDQAQRTDFPSQGTRVRLLCFAAAYPHKCIDIVPHTARELARLLPQLDFEFVLTLPHDDPLWTRIRRDAHRLGVAARVTNEGPIAVADGPALYRSCHVCFMPTVLESFTATYPEAMAMGLPIVTSDLDFAQSICQDAAAYFRPRDPVHAAEQLRCLLTSQDRWTSLVTAGKRVLAGLPRPRRKFECYLELLERTASGLDLRGHMPPAREQAGLVA